MAKHHQPGSRPPRTASGRPHAPRPREAAPTILFRDDVLVVVDKPAALAVTPGAPASLQLAAGIDDEARPVHWIDDPASGAAIFALARDAAESLWAQQADGRLRVVCHALVRASGLSAEGLIELDVQRPPRSAGAGGSPDPPAGPAVTAWRCLDAFVGFALLECVPRPGLPCQVRAHLAAAGMPLAVDPNFGGDRELRLSSFKVGYRESRRREERPLLARMSLHVAAVEFDHPRNGERRRVEAPYARDFRAAVQQLGKYGRVPNE